MQKTLILTVVYLCMNCLCLAQKAKDSSLIINHINIINVVNGKVLTDQSILIEANKIAAIGDFNSFQKKAKSIPTIDASDKYMIPGLWDMHVHIEGENLVEDNKALMDVYIAYGITTVRDAASDLGEQVLAWRDEINEGKLFGPRIFTAGRKLEGINSIWKGDLEIANEIELNQMLDKLDNYKVDFVKITENTLPGDLFLKSVIASKKRGYKVSGHVPADLSIFELANAGFSSIEHASYLLRLGSDDQKIVDKTRSKALTNSQAGRAYADFDQQKAFEGYQYLAQKGVAICPTLIGGKQLAYYDEDNHQNDPYRAYLTNRFLSNYQWRLGRMQQDTPQQFESRKERYQLIAKQLPFIQKAGMTILAGSDAAALNTFVYPALALHEELQLFQTAGLTPLEILQTATINGAKFMGKATSLATIENGKIADMVILNTNPLDDISSTLDIHAVVKNGEYLNRNKLDELLQKAKDRRNQLNQERND